MSHIVQIQTQVSDPVAIQAACQRLKLPAAEQRTVQLFSAQATGWVVELPAWHYPVVFNTAQAQVQFDNFGGRWGDPKELDRFLQAYAIEKTFLEARKQGHTVSEQQRADGSVKLMIQVGGAA